VFSHGAVEITNKENRHYKVNGQKLKPYNGGEFNKHEDTFNLNTIG